LPIQNNHKEIVELLIAKGAEVNVTDSRGRTPAHWAANRQRAQILRLLANTTGKHGWTPLHWAARHGKRAMAELLLSNGARVDIKDDEGQTPLDIAIKYMDDDHRRIYIVELLREYEGRKATQSQD
jgi:ankyrin repeat protein